MGLSRSDFQAGRNLSAPSPGLVDFIVHRLQAGDISHRQLAGWTGLGKSRLGTTLHLDPRKRRPMRLDEVVKVLDALDIDRLEAHLANELLSQDRLAGDRDRDRLIEMVSELVRGLPTKIADVLEHIDGLDGADIRREHGRRLQAAIIELVKAEYTEIVRRRDMRFAAPRL